MISILDNDVTELNVLVLTLQEENAQLQQTVNLLLQRVAVLETTDTITNNTLDGTIYLFKFNVILLVSYLVFHDTHFCQIRQT